MYWLIWLAIGLLVLWVAAQALGWVLGAAIHAFWIGALGLLGFWLFQQARQFV